MRLSSLEMAKAFHPLLRRHRAALGVIIVLGTLSALAEGIGMSLVIPFFRELAGGSAPGASHYVRFLDRMLASLPAGYRTSLIPAVIFAIVIAKNVLSYVCDCLCAWLKLRVGHELRGGLFNQLLHVHFGFIERSEPAKLVNTLAHETWRTVEALGVFVALLIHCATVLVFVVLLLLISWPLTLSAGAGVVLISVSVQLVGRRLGRLGTHAVDATAALTERMLDGLGGMRVIRIFGRERYEEQRFAAASEDVRRTFQRLDWVANVVKPLSEIGYAAMFLLVLAFAFRSRGLLPTLLAFVFFLYRLLPHLKHLAASRTTLAAFLSSVRDVTALLDRTDKTYTASGTIPFRRLENDVRFKSVTFSYKAEDGPVLHDVSLSIPRGKTTAIVGPSGAGKSTLANLLFRLYDATEGELRVDGIPLPHLDLASWRENIAFAGHDSHLFGGTVRDNIAYGSPQATFEDIVAAADLAAADGFIRGLPQGYETRVGDRGLRLSAGERQRIVLARAFLRKPQILVLDEATNALDSLSEHRIRLALKKLGEDNTVVLIAHRMSTVEHADQIIVMDGGRIVEQGTYDDLLRRGGTFAELSRMQQRRRIAAGPR